MDINRANLDALYTGFNTKFQAGMAKAGDSWQRWAYTQPSTTAKETYGFLEVLSKMRKWVGERVWNNVKNNTLEVANIDYESSIGVSRNDIEDDIIGMYGPMFEEMGFGNSYLWQELATQALMNGWSNKWLDNKAFFSATHKYGKNTIDNADTAALAAAAFEAAYTAMQSYVGADDVPLRVVPDLLIVGPSLRDTAWDIVENDYAYDATAKVQRSNRNKGKAEILVLPELVGSYANYWFLTDTRGVIKPVAVQQRKIGTLQRWDSDQDENVKNNNEFQYGVHSRGNSVGTLPHLIYGSTGAA